MTLNKKRILITRPTEQADTLSQLISSNDGVSIQLPTIQIRPLEKTKELLKDINDLKLSDFIIFVSRNAVKVAFDNFLNNIEIFSSIKIVALGPGTMRELAARGFKDIIYSNQADTEGLLMLKEIQDKRISGKKISIVRGVGGRELLARNLKERGANVKYIDIYKRSLPHYDQTELDEVWCKKKPDIILVTSIDILDNLMILFKNYKNELLDTPLVVISDRVSKYAKKNGFISKICIVKEKEDSGIFQCLLEIAGE